MLLIKKTLAAFARDEDGATLVEYGIALGLAITLGAGALTLLAADVGASMDSAGCALPSQGATRTGC